MEEFAGRKVVPLRPAPRIATNTPTSGTRVMIANGLGGSSLRHVWLGRRELVPPTPRPTLGHQISLRPNWIIRESRADARPKDDGETYWICGSVSPGAGGRSVLAKD